MCVCILYGSTCATHIGPHPPLGSLPLGFVIQFSLYLTTRVCADRLLSFLFMYIYYIMYIYFVYVFKLIFIRILLDYLSAKLIKLGKYIN